MKATHKVDDAIHALRRVALMKDAKSLALLVAWLVVGWGLESLDDARLLGGLLWFSIFANGVLWLALNGVLADAEGRRGQG